MEEKMRLQKLMAHQGICSRRKAEELISEGKVKVNGTVITEMGYLASEEDKIEVEGYSGDNSSKEETVAFLFNKPTGVLSSASDDRGRKTVIDFFKNENKRLYPAGRLDYATSGALIITNDGELANLITHPSSHLEKTYVATVKEKTDESKMDILRKGVLLEDGMTQPAKVTVVMNSQEKSIIRVTIHEGRNRQVRRMFEAVGYHVSALHRESVGFLNVKGIERGNYRKLSEEEISFIKKLCLSNKSKNVIPDYKRKN